MTPSSPSTENFPSTQGIYRLEKIIVGSPPMSAPPTHTRSLQTFNAKGQGNTSPPGRRALMATDQRPLPGTSLPCPGAAVELTHSALLSSTGRSGCWGLRGTGQGQAGGRPIPDSVGCSGAPPTTSTTTTQSVSRVLNKTHTARPIVHTRQRLVSIPFP